MLSNPIMLAGPPGAGKTSVAARVAERLGARYVDLDDEIARRERRRVPDILREDGEPSFRSIEARTLSGLDGADVIALGGGTLTTPAGRAAARRKGLLFGLEAPTEVLAGRLRHAPGDRPLLESPGGLEALLAARRASYAAVDRRIPATGTVDEVAERVVDAARTTHVVASEVGPHAARIVVGEDLSSVGPVAALAPKRRVVLIADAGVPAPRRSALLAELSAHFPVHLEEVPGGEIVKRFTVLEGILERASAAGAGRQSVVVGVGGGATCDLAGLVAALLGRGAPLVLVPTTLLAQVDASVGGKCAINLAAGRNLVGAFHPAGDVVIDLSLLSSLPDAELRSGLAEALKIGIIADAPLFERLSAAPGPPSPADVAAAVRHKAEIVRRDPFERGERKVLNLGHTLGHALESASDYALRHGEAVSIGIAAVARLGAARGWTAPDVAERVIGGLGRAGLPVGAPRALLEASRGFLRRDKKAEDAGVDLVIIEGLGRVGSKRVSWESVEDALVESGLEARAGAPSFGGKS